MKRSLHFNDNFPGGPGLAGNRMSPFWILLQLRMMEAVVTTGVTRCAKLQSNHHHQQTNIQLFYRPDALPFSTLTLLVGWQPNQQCQSTGGKTGVMELMETFAFNAFSQTVRTSMRQEILLQLSEKNPWNGDPGAKPVTPVKQKTSHRNWQWYEHRRHEVHSLAHTRFLVSRRRCLQCTNCISASSVQHLTLLITVKNQLQTAVVLQTCLTWIIA